MEASPMCSNDLEWFVSAIFEICTVEAGLLTLAAGKDGL